MEISPEEEFLIARCVRKDRESLALLLLRYGRPVAAFTRMLLPAAEEDEVRNIVARILAATLRSTRPFEEKEPFLVEALGYALDEIKRSRASTLGKQRFKKEDAFGARIYLIKKALNDLAPQERLLILLRDQMDLSYEEIAYLVPGSQHFLKTRISEARIKFHQNLANILSQKEKEHERLP